MTQSQLNAQAYDRGLFRYNIVASLFANPPPTGDLAARLREMSQQIHVQPWNKKQVKISVRTLERWYAQARRATRPPEALQPKLRKDRQQSRVLLKEHKQWLVEFQQRFPSWSVQLLFDNMCADIFSDVQPSYSTVLRYFKAQGLFKHPSRARHQNSKQIRSYEVEFVGQLWHMDFHKGSRMVLTEAGQFEQPICMAIVDDKSRLVCHVQWFLNETAEVLVHGLCQAIAKRGMPATFYTDNGAAMKAQELLTGLECLGIKQEHTLPYAAYQNGKQESFWKPLEGRLMKMIPKEKRITLDVLNSLTQAWVEQDYHTTIHSETRQTPLRRFFEEKNVLRHGLDFKEMKRIFRMRLTRTVRKTDATVTLDGVRFQLPQHYAHFDQLVLRYARWDLGEAEILCPDTFKPLCQIFPVNKLANSLGIRGVNQSLTQNQREETNEISDGLLTLECASLPPLLARCLAKHARENRLSGYMPLSNEGSTL